MKIIPYGKECYACFRTRRRNFRPKTFEELQDARAKAPEIDEKFQVCRKESFFAEG